MEWMASLAKDDIILIAALSSIFLVGIAFIFVYCLHRRERNRWVRGWERERRIREGSARYDEGGFERSDSFIYLAGDSIGIYSVTRV